MGEEDDELRDISKQEACRRVLHLAIRLQIRGEDPLAAHLLCQSAEKVLSDLHKRKFGKHSYELFFKSNLNKYQKDKFFKDIRSNYNFLKHADNNIDKAVKERDFLLMNELCIFSCCFFYSKIFISSSCHMFYFQRMVGQIHPDMFDWKSVYERHPELQLGSEVALNLIAERGRGIAYAAFNEALKKDGPLKQEEDADKISTTKALRW